MTAFKNAHYFSHLIQWEEQVDIWKQTGCYDDSFLKELILQTKYTIQELYYAIELLPYFKCSCDF